MSDVPAVPASAPDAQPGVPPTSAAVAVETQRVDLGALLTGTATPDDIFESSQATTLGIEARGKGDLALARRLYQRSLEIDSPNDFIAACANLCDLDRMEGNLEAAHAMADRGIAMARHLAVKYGIALEDAGKGHDDPEQGASLKTFWFAYAKVLNFKALCYRAAFDKSGVGEGRNFKFLEQSTALNAQAVQIVETMGHGYRQKAIVDLLSDRLEANDPTQWTAAIGEAGRYLAAGGLNPNRAHNFHVVQGRAHLNLGDVEAAVTAFHTAYEVSKQADLKREAANDLVEMLGALCLNGREGEAAAFYDELDGRLADLAPFDIAAQKRFLLAIHAHHPLRPPFSDAPITPA